MVKNTRGQIWIETVIYTLIALVMIGLVLAFARPKIQELQDKAIIIQSIEMMKEIDSVILNLGNRGNKRIIELGIKKGDLILDVENEKLIFEIESRSEYSEIDAEISDGNILVKTTKEASANLVTLTRDYSGSSYNLQFDGAEVPKTLTVGSVPYKLSITQATNPGDPKTVINMELI